MNKFKVKDLMINVVPEKVTGGGGSSLCTVEQASIDYTPLTPTTPVILVAKHMEKFQAIDVVGQDIDKISPELLDAVALDVGRAALAGRFVHGAASCTADMPTCNANNPWISPVAASVDLQLEDLPQLKLELGELVRGIDEVLASWEGQTFEHRRELLPKFEAIVEEWRAQGKG